MSTDARIPDIKRKFTAYRNGVIADTLRSAGMNCYRIIFGLNVPQISTIAKEFGHDNQLAHELWADCGVRESRLLATYLFNPCDITINKCLKLVSELQTREEADMLCFRLLRHTPFADKLPDMIEATPGELSSHTAEVLRRHNANHHQG